MQTRINRWRLELLNVLLLWHEERADRLRNTVARMAEEHFIAVMRRQPKGRR